MHRATSPEVSAPSVTLIELFESRVADDPGALAYGFVLDELRLGAQLTRGELDVRARMIGAALQARATPGAAVLLVYPAGLEFVCAFWGCVLAGMVPVPVASLDAARLGSALPRLQAIAADAQAQLVLCDRRTLAQAQMAGADVGRWLATDAATRAPLAPAPRRSSDGAYLQYTSGSTSAPRGVVIGHDSVLANCAGLSLALRPDAASAVLSWLPHFHDYGLVHGIVWPLFAGIPSYLMSPLTFLRRPLRWLEAIERFGITHSGAPNFAYAACVAALDEHPEWRGDLRRWGFASCGAEPIDATTAREFSQRFAAHGLPAHAYAPAYGLAEATLLVSVKATDRPFTTMCVDGDELARGRVRCVDDGAAGVRELVACGAPIEGLDVRVVDPQTRLSCPPDCVGELCIAGSSLGHGYHGRGDTDDQVFGQRIAGDDASRWLRSGDLGFVRDGNVFVTGRLKDLLIVNGRNVYPQDLEWTVQRACAGLRAGHGAAFAVPAAIGERVVIVQEAERRVAADQLAHIAASIRKALAAEHELPAHTLLLVRPGSVARTSSGKIQRSRCRDDYQQGRLAVLWNDDPTALSDPAALRAASASGGDVWPALREAAARIARRGIETLRPERSAIENGLDSLQCYRLIDWAQRERGVVLPAGAVLGDETLAALAARLQGTRTVDAPPVVTEPPAAAASDDATTPLSWQQQGVWFADRIGDNGLYNLVQATRVRGSLDIARLQHALAQLVERHEALGLSIVEVDGTPVQQASATASVPWQVTDLRTIPAGARADALAQQLDVLARHRFDLSAAPLVRAAVWQLAPDEHVVALLVHHLVFDGWSAALLMCEWADAYGGRSAATSAPAYRRFVAWQRRWVDEATARAMLQQARDHLADVPPLELPTERARPSRPSFEGAVVRFELDGERTQGLQQLAARENVTLFMLLMAVFQTQLLRISGQEDFAVGAPAASRPGEYERTVGLFTNTLVLRASLSGDPPFRTLLERVRQEAQRAAAQQMLPFDRVAESLAMARDLRRNVLFQVGFAMQSMGDTTLRLPALGCEALPLHNGTSRTDLWLTVTDVAGVLHAELEFATDLFDLAAAQRLAAQFQRLVDAVLADPSTPLSRLTILGDAERRFLLEQCNQTQRDYPLQWCMHELIEQQAQRTPQRTAVRCGAATLDYAELDSRANRLAHRLRALGVGPEVIVGVCLHRSLDLSVALLAVLKAGGGYLPLDPDLPAQRLAYMLGDAAARVVLTHSELLDALPADAHHATLSIDALDPPLRDEPADRAPLAAAQPQHTAYVIYTSGSTGQAKGVTVSHRAMCNHKHWEVEALGLDASHRVLQKTTISFDASVFELFTALQVGGTVVMAAPGAQRDMRLLVAEVRRHRITHLVMTPSAARALLEEPELDRCGSLQHLLFGGEALDPALVRAFRARLPHLRIGNFYGPSETTEDATHHEVLGMPDGSTPLPIGRPVANMRCHVLDAARQPVPVGVVGELYIGGAGLSRGYLNRPELTAERFVVDPFHLGERLYRTGDLARYRSDGALVYVGRADAQIKVRGQRIEPGEVEATLLRYPGVRRATVVARADARGELELAAYVVAESYDESALRRRLHEWLPAGWIPTSLVALSELPTLPNGKIDLRALAARSDATTRTRPVDPPRSGTEHRVHALWTQLLGRQPIGVHDNFFESGGHSLIATQLVARIRTQLGANLPLRSVFEHPTIAALAAEIDVVLVRDAVHRETPITAVPRERPLPLSYSQQRMWLVQQMDPQGSAYNMPFAARIRGPLDVPALQQALAWLAERHEALRTSIHLARDGATQVIAPSVTVPFQLCDLSDEAADTREPRAREVAQRESRRPFDLSQPPLWRALLMRLQPQEHVLLIVLHHVIGDQWSGGVLVRDLAQAYRSARADRPPAWPALRIQYGDYAAWQRVHQSPVALSAELDYWADRLRTTPPLALPADGGEEAPGGTPGAMLIRTLTPETTRAMRALAAAHDATPFMVLLAAFKLLLSRYCGQTDIAIGTPIANRMRADTEELVGTMVNTLVLRTELAGSATFCDLLLRVKDTALQAYAHQSLPYEQLVDALRGAGGAVSPAHVRVLFNVPNAPWVHPDLPGTAIEPFDFDRGAAQFDLSVTVDTEHFHRVHIEYATALFSHDLAQQLGAHYVHLLQQVLAAPAAPLASLPTLTAAESSALQQSHRTTARALPPVQRVDELVSAQAAQTPDAIALSQGAQHIRYRDLERRANQLAHHLQSLGVGPGALVGLCLQRSPEMVIALLAVMKAGAAYVPLDPAFPRERLRFMVDDAALSWVVTHRAVHDAPAPASGRVLDLDAHADAVASAADTPPRNSAGLRDLAYVLYTSGSTGRPKGVQIEHRSLLNFIASMAREPGAAPGDTLLAVTTLSFDIAGLELLLPLAVGARVEVATREEAADPGLLIERLAALRPTLMQATPATWRMLLEAGWPGDPRLTILCGGEALSAELAARLRPRCRALWNLYGPTETTIWSTVERVEHGSPITIGCPIDNTTCLILDPQLQPVPTGVAGELCIGGLGVARGYHARSELSAERFVPDPFAAEADGRLYRTGDVAKRLRDGRLLHLGRNDFQVKVRGFRIELGDIESALASHASVAHGVVAATDDATGSKQLVAYVVTRAGATMDAQALRTHLRTVLPDYMVPSYFVPLAALPMTASRKVDVNALPRPNAADAAARDAAGPIDPQSLLAVQLLALWRQVLEDDALGLDDNFFEHGGHSLKAVQLLTQIERVFGRRLPLATLVEAPSVARLEQALSRADWTPPWRSLVALAVHGDRAPLFLVPGVGGNVLVFTALARLLDGERPVYGLQPRGLDGIEAPFRSLTDMAAHHVAEMRAVQPHGPYLIGGACTGGVVAYEMAQQLRAQGEAVELLVLESWHPSSYRPPSTWRRARLALRAGLKRLRSSAATFAGLPMARWPAALQRLWQPRAHSDVTLQETLAGHDYLADRVVAATFEAVASYEALPYPDRLLNVIAAERPLLPGVVDTRPLWDSLALGGARHVELAAQDSGRLFVSPHVEQLTGVLREYIGTRL